MKDNGTNLVPIHMEPSSSSGIDLPMEDEHTPK